MSNQTSLHFDASAYEVGTAVDGSITITLDPALYEANRPEGATVAAEKLVDGYRQSYAAAVIEGAAPVVAAAMKKDKTLNTAVISSLVKGFEVEATVSRTREGYNPKTREPLTTYGTTMVRVTTNYRKIGAIKAACTTMADQIKEKLGKS